MIFLNMSLIRKFSFEMAAHEWLAFKKQSIKESTFYRYKYIIYEYLIPVINVSKINELRNFDFNDFIDVLSMRLAKSTVLNIITVLKSILRYCERKYGCDLKLDLISSFKGPRRDVKVLSDFECDRIERFCAKELSFKNLGIIICLNTGIRVGELCALKWCDVDLKNRKIYITKTIQRIYEKNCRTFLKVDAPKSEMSKRVIPISKKLLKVMSEFLCVNAIEDTKYVVNGKSIFAEPRMMQHHFKRVLERCDLNVYNFHVLRHTFATRCIQSGMDVKSLSEILGHSSVNITLNKYVHSSFETKLKGVDRL